MKKKVQEVFNKKIAHMILLLFCDICAIFCALLLALWLRFDLHEIPHNFIHNALQYSIIDIVITVAIFYAFGLYTSVWSYAPITELISIILACFTSTAVKFIYKNIVNVDMPRSIYFIDLVIIIFFICGIRYSYRIARIFAKNISKRNATNNIMLIGGGEAARLLIDEMNRNKAYEDSRVVCIIDDDKQKIGSRIRGIQVVGNRHAIEYAAYKYKVNQIIITIPSANKKSIAKIVTECQKTNCEIKILPALYLSVDQEQENIAQHIRPIKYEDFLGRDQIVVNNQEITDNLTDKTILVTGGAGASVPSFAAKSPLRSLNF